MKTRLVPLAVLAAALSVALVAPLPLALLALLLPLVAVVTGPRLALDPLGQTVVSLAAMVVGVLAPRVLPGADSTDVVGALSQEALGLALPVLAIAGARALLREPRFGDRLTLAAGLVALTAAGRALPSPTFPALSALFLALAFAGLAVGDPGRAPLRLLGARHRVALICVLLATAGLAVAAAQVLPVLQARAMARLQERFRARIGFGDRLMLGSMRGLLVDDTVVLRVRGEPDSPLLRGAVFGDYALGGWKAPPELAAPTIVEGPSVPPERWGSVELEATGRVDRYFLPLGAAEVRTSSGVFSRDKVGIHRALRGAEAKRTWYFEGGASQCDAPDHADLAVPRAIRPALERLVAGWQVDRGRPDQRLARLERELSTRYRYSLEQERTPGHDPVLDFLEVHPAGHCEYFAASMVLLARAAGVPARVVTGYRVSERSPFGYLIVRRRHAHAWVEGWDGVRWRTFDPTPSAELAAASTSLTPWPSALLDATGTAWQALDDWLARRTTFELSLAIAVLAGVLAVVRALRGRATPSNGARSGEAPLPGFIALERALGARGLARRASETLACYRERLEHAASLDSTRRGRAARALAAYSELRYAGRGDPATIDGELAQVASSLR